MQQVHISETALEEILFFEQDAELFTNEELLKKPSMALLMKRSSENLPNTIDDVVAQMIYGNHRKPPGDENSSYRKLLQKKDDDVTLPGIWVPTNSFCKAMALKWFFPNISGPYKLSEVDPIPPHIIIAYDAFKYREVMDLGNHYPNAIMKYGFFSNDIPGAAQLITKTVDKFEKKLTPPTYEEKIVVQLAKSDDWLDAFYDLGPSYASPDAVQGAEEAKIFFPPTYDIPEDIIMEIKKKPKKKTKSKFVAVVEAHEEKLLQGEKGEGEEQSLEERVSEEGREVTEEKATEMEEEEEEGEEDGGEDIADKATSPIDVGKEEEVNEETKE